MPAAPHYVTEFPLSMLGQISRDSEHTINCLLVSTKPEILQRQILILLVKLSSSPPITYSALPP